MPEEGEADEDGDQDERRAGDGARAGRDVGDRVSGVTGLQVALPIRVSRKIS
jgi:hypothetical protein